MSNMMTVEGSQFLEKRPAGNALQRIQNPSVFLYFNNHAKLRNIKASPFDHGIWLAKGPSISRSSLSGKGFSGLGAGKAIVARHRGLDSIQMLDSEWKTHMHKKMCTRALILGQPSYPLPLQGEVYPPLAAPEATRVYPPLAAPEATRVYPPLAGLRRG
jgi:hypothetical protein